MEAIDRLIQAFNKLSCREAPIEERIREGLEIGRDFLDADHAFVHRFEKDRRIVEFVRGDNDISPGAKEPVEQKCCGRTNKTGRCCSVKDSTELSDSPDIHEMEAYFARTITIKGEVYGSISFADDQPRDEITTRERRCASLVINYLTELLRQREEQKQLAMQRDFFQDVTDQLPGIVYEFAAKDDGFAFTYISKGVEEVAGVSAEAVRDDFNNALEAIHPDDRPEVLNAIEKTVEANEDFDAEFRFGNDDDFTWARVQALPADHPEFGTVWRGLIVDITDLKETQKALKAANERKSMLIKEVNHRVKNNLQLITSLLNMQQRGIDSSEARQALAESRERIKAIATTHRLVHDKARSDGRVGVADYLKQLVEQLKTINGGCAFDCVVNDQNDPPTTLGPDRLIGFGMALNEILTNACQYAGEVTVRGEIDDTIHVVITDNGPGTTREELQSEGGLGWELITGLIEYELDGTITVEGDDGTTIDVTLPLQQSGSADPDTA